MVTQMQLSVGAPLRAQVSAVPLAADAWLRIPNAMRKWSVGICDQGTTSRAQAQIPRYAKALQYLS